MRTHRYRIGHGAVMAIRDKLAGRGDDRRIVDLGVEIMRRRSTDRRAALASDAPRRRRKATAR